MVRDTTRLCQLASLALMGIVFAGLGTWLILAGPNPVAASAPLPSSAIKTHRVVVLVDSDDMKVMKHAISYSFNAARYCNAKSEPITIEIVANGTGIKEEPECPGSLRTQIDRLRELEAQSPSIIPAAERWDKRRR